MLSATVASASAAFRRTQLATEGMPVRLVRKSMYQPGGARFGSFGIVASKRSPAPRLNGIHETLIRVEAMRRRRRPNEAHPPDVGGLAALDVDGLAIDKRLGDTIDHRPRPSKQIRRMEELEAQLFVAARRIDPP